MASRGDQHDQRERRKSFRCTVQGARSRGRMRVGTRNLPIEVLDESAEGLAIEMQGTPNCTVGDAVFVEIAGAWVEAQVVNLLPSNVPDDQPGEESAETPITRTRLGLARLREVEASLIDPPDLALFSRQRFRSLLRPLMPLSKSFKGTAAALVAIVAVGIMLVWVLENAAPLAGKLRQKSKHDETLRDLAQFAPTEKRTSHETKPVTLPEAKEPQAPREPEAPTEAAAKLPEGPPVSTLDTLPRGIVRLAHPEFLLKPEIIKLLELTRAQRDQLRELFAQYQASTAEFIKAGGDPLVELGRRCLEILTEKQRQSLAQLHAAMRDVPGATTSSPDSQPANGTVESAASSRG